MKVLARVPGSIPVAWVWVFPLLAVLPQAPPPYLDALRALARGDTSLTVVRLRQVTRDHPDFAEGWGRLGQLLALRASGVASRFEERLEAEEALRRALRLDSDHPRYLSALGLLLRKQQAYNDARRVLARARNALKRHADVLEPREGAELLYQLGLFSEDVYLDDYRSVRPFGLPVRTPECADIIVDPEGFAALGPDRPGSGDFCLNFIRPRRFNEILSGAIDLSKDAEDEWSATRTAFLEALRIDPTHTGAFRRLAIHLYDRGEFEEMEQVCRAFLEAAPSDPWGYLLLGLLRSLEGHDSAAALAFREGLNRSPPFFGEHLRDVENLLRPDLAEQYRMAAPEARRAFEPLLWRKSDPLYLTPQNERWIEHMARVVYADVMFEDLSTGLYGAETEPGVIYVRYGPPRRIWKVAKGSLTGSLREPGGRWIFWNYADSLPNFIFEKTLRWRRMSHGLTTFSKAMEEESRKREPTAYRPPFPYQPMALRVARFKGQASDIEVDFYAVVEADRLTAVKGDTVEAGLFLFDPRDHQSILERRVRFPGRRRAQPLTFTVSVTQDSLLYSVEARPRAMRAAGVARGTVIASPFPSDRVSLSDLLIAEGVEPLASEPLGRRHFRIAVLSTDTVGVGLPFTLYWEVYGLQAGADSMLHYEVTLRVQGVDEKGVLADVVSFFGRALGFTRREDLSLLWQRSTAPKGDRIPEFVEVSLGERKPGRYRAMVEVRDLVTGHIAATSYAFIWAELEESRE